MATTYTENYHLGKQEDKTDKFDMSVITDNADKIDEALTAKVDKSARIAGIDLSTNISVAELQTALNVEDGANKTVVDSSLSSSSANPVQNKKVYEALQGKYNVQADGIPKTDLESTVQVSLNKADSAATQTQIQNLQAQIDEIITHVTQDAEVINARVDANGVTHATLKERCDSDYNKLKEDLTKAENEIFFTTQLRENYSQSNKAIDYSQGGYVGVVDASGFGVHLFNISQHTGEKIHIELSNYANHISAVFFKNNSIASGFIAVAHDFDTIPEDATQIAITSLSEIPDSDKVGIYKSKIEKNANDILAKQPKLTAGQNIIIDNNNIISTNAKADTLGMRFYKTVDAKSVVVYPDNVAINAGETLYVKAVSCDNPDKPRLTIYGMKGETQAEGYDSLKTISFGESATIEINRNYHHLQFTPEPYVSGQRSNFVAEYGTLGSEGILQDIIKLNIKNYTPVKFGNETYKIFKKVVCCGDSYTAGYIKLNGETAVEANPEFSWPHYISIKSGNNWFNCGLSGANVLTWLSNSAGLEKARSAGTTQAYVIGLMINDTSGERNVPLGTVADVETDTPTTYYGGMAKIVRELHAISPQAKIFINTCPAEKDNVSRYSAYNNAVRTIAEMYNASYNTYCIDLASQADLYDYPALNGDQLNGHYTAIGYEQFAEIYAYILSIYINSNIANFQDVFKIPYSN